MDFDSTQQRRKKTHGHYNYNKQTVSDVSATEMKEIDNSINENIDKSEYSSAIKKQKEPPKCHMRTQSERKKRTLQKTEQKYIDTLMDGVCVCACLLLLSLLT